MPRNLLRLRWALGLTGVAVVLLAGVLAYQAVQARTALLTVAGDFQHLADSVRSGDEQSARTALDSAREESRRAENATDGVLWGAATQAPVLGDDVDAVRTVAQVSRTLSDDALGGVVAASEAVNPEQLSPRRGRISLAPLTKVAPTIVAADEQLHAQVDRVDQIDTGALVAQLASPVEEMQRKLSAAATLSSRASYAVRLLPPMLGADGPRNYLVLFQNNAEIRATGGIPGALAVMRADRGKLSLVRQGTASDLGIHQKPPIPLTREETALYERKLGTYGADINFTPDFPRTAELAQAMWRVTKGQKVDGVLSADPVALSYLLEATGPVRVPGGVTLSSGNAVDVLLSDVYRRQADPEKQNAFFASAARTVFTAVVSGKADPSALLDGLTRGATDGRLFAWSDVPAEQRLLEETPLAGAVPRQAGPSPYVGVFMNDGTAAKMEYYLDHRVDVKPVGCNSEGRQELEVTVTVKSDAPRRAADLPVSVIGPRKGKSWFGVEPGHMRLNVHLYAPIGGWIRASAVDGQETPLNELEHDGHPVGSQTVDLGPGEARRLTYTVMTGVQQPGPVELRVTPGAHGSGVGDVAPNACGGS